MSAKLETKDFKLAELAVSDDEGTFTGYASVFGNVDSYNDVVDRGAFKKTLEEQPVVPILWQHDPYEPIGVSVELSEDRKGLAVKGELNLDTQRGAEAHALLKQGALKGLSIGYRTIKDQVKDGARHLKEVRLFEFSPVTFPANTRAAVSQVKSMLDTLDEISTKDALSTLTSELLDSGVDERELVTELRSLLDSIETPAAEQDAFLAEIRSFRVGNRDAVPETLRGIVDDLKSLARKE